MKPALVIFSIFILLILGLSCQSKLKLIQPLKQEDTSVPLTPNTKRNLSFNFPTSTDLYVVSGEFSITYGRIIRGINSYRRTTGAYPESMTQYINSGFPLLWSRNVLNGSVVSSAKKDNLTLDRSDASHFIWIKNDDSHAVFKYISPNGAKYRDYGTEEWVERAWDLEFGTHDPYNPESRRFEYAYEYDNTITIQGGTKVINHINESDIKWLYSLCGQLVNYVDTRTDYFHAHTHTLPNDFSDLIHESNLFIKENLYKLAELLNNENIEFKIGFDYNKDTLYSVLWINGEKYIYYCFNFGNSLLPTPEAEPYQGKFYHCVMDELDMSSPMISGKNFNDFIQSIPDDVLMAVKDIPNE